MNFTLEMDHKPLVPRLGGTKSLAELPPRILRFRMQFMSFMYTIKQVPGKNLATAKCPVMNPSLQAKPSQPPA